MFSTCKVARRFLATQSKALSGRVALVTGSTSGIGLGIARSLASQGSSVVLNGFGPADEIRKLKEDLAKEFGVKVEYHAANLAKAEEIKDLHKFTVEKFGNLDILVNNAGIQHVSPVDKFPDDKWDAVIAINLTSVFHTIKLFLPQMKERQWGRIINVSSVHGIVASAEKSAYVAAKHGVVGLTKTVALETAGKGVTCNCINPGWVKTPLVEKQIEAKAQALNVSFEKATEILLSEKQPSKQFVQVEDLANAVLFLCSPSASQMTGTNIVMDGGWTAQ